MSVARSLAFAGALSLSALACGSAPDVARGPRVGPPPPPIASAIPPTPSPARCESLRAAHPIPLTAGRGDRVVLARAGDRTLAYVADEDEDAVHTIDVGAGREIAVTPVDGAPSALVALRDGRLVAALRDRNELVVLEPASRIESPLEMRCAAPVASEPVGLGATEVEGEAEEVLVASGYGHALTALGGSDLAPRFVVALPRDPRAVLVLDHRAYVSHMTSSELSVVDTTSGELASVDVLGGRKPDGVALRTRDEPGPEPEKIHGGQAFSLASAEGRLYAPMVTVDPGEPKITGAYGSTEIPIKPFVGIVDVESASALRVDVASQTVPSTRACMLPRAAAAAPGGRLFVACAGIDELLELDGRADGAMHALRRRVRVPEGPLGIALDASRVVVWSEFAREVSVIPLSGVTDAVRVAVSRRERPRDLAFERGRVIFHDSFDLRVSSDGRACASCHPDGRDDGNTWSTPDGPRQTIALAGRVDGSGPYGWFGKHPTLDSHLGETMHRLGGAGFGKKSDRADLDALEHYLVSMKAPVPVRVDDDRVRAGRALFHDPKQGCGSCHAEGSTDRARHDVGSGHREEASTRFDTPSLAFVSASAPYFHDGRYPSLDALLAKGDDEMGHVRHLDADERAALVAYMSSIAPAAEPTAVAASFAPPDPLAPLPADAASPAERALIASSPPPLVLDGVAVDLDAIPVVETHAPIAWDAKSADAKGEALAPDQIVWKNGCAAIPHHAAATLRLDWRTTSMTDALERCVYAPDENGIFRWADGATTTIDPLPGGRLRVVTRDVETRLGTREIRVAREVDAEAVPLVTGLVYAYRTKCDDCKEGRDVLHVVWPSDAESIFSTAALSLERGRAAHTEITVAPWNLGPWIKATGAKLETKSRLGHPRSTVVRLDVSRTRSEGEARVALGRGSCEAQPFGSCL